MKGKVDSLGKRKTESEWLVSASLLAAILVSQHVQTTHKPGPSAQMQCPRFCCDLYRFFLPMYIHRPD